MDNKNYIYLIRRREHVRLDEPIYKIGHTTRGIERLKEYDGGIGIEVHAMFPVLDSAEAEKRLIKLFDCKYENALKCTGSKESYKGDIDEMIKDIRKVAKGYDPTKDVINGGKSVEPRKLPLPLFQPNLHLSACQDINIDKVNIKHNDEIGLIYEKKSNNINEISNKDTLLHIYRIPNEVIINDISYFPYELESCTKTELLNIVTHLKGYISSNKLKKDIIDYLNDIWPKFLIVYDDIKISSNVYKFHELVTYTKKDLMLIITELGIDGNMSWKKDDLIYEIENNWPLLRSTGDLEEYNYVIH